MFINKMAKSVDPNQTAHYEPSHLDLHCLHWLLYRSTGFKELKNLPLRRNRIYISGTILRHNSEIMFVGKVFE